MYTPPILEFRRRVLPKALGDEQLEGMSHVHGKGHHPTPPVAVVVAHGHHSSNIELSAEDRGVTRRLHDAGQRIGITVLDRLIISRNGNNWLLEHDMIQAASGAIDARNQMCNH